MSLCIYTHRSIALHAGLWVNGSIQDGYLVSGILSSMIAYVTCYSISQAASSDETTQTVFDTVRNLIAINNAEVTISLVWLCVNEYIFCKIP